MPDRDRARFAPGVIPNAKREVLQAEILREIEQGSTVYTDGWPGCDTLAERWLTKPSTT